MSFDSNTALTFFTFFSALILSLILTPVARVSALLLNIIDHPINPVKTHREPVPYLGGVAIYVAFTFSLLWIRVLTSFPTGTLTALRGIVIGGTLIFLTGLIDDIRHGGLDYRTKFLVQVVAAIIVIAFGIHIKFIKPVWLGYLLTLIWIVGITNAFNIIDIMNGLSSGVAVVASFAFLFIALPSEAIYVNFLAAALAGSALGFIPYNLSKSWRLFMGDSGSLFLGFVTASLAIGMSYGSESGWVVLAPVLILGIPIFDTTLVFCIRISHGLSPFLGSKDHFPLRLERLGWNRSWILVFCLSLGAAFGFGALLITRLYTAHALNILLAYGIFMGLFTIYLLRAKSE